MDGSILCTCVSLLYDEEDDADVNALVLADAKAGLESLSFSDKY